jgi:hypothetical protein
VPRLASSILASAVPSALRLAVLGACLLAACTDFDTPSELQKATVLAVVADPPVTPPGASSRLELVLVDGAGRVATPEATWRLVETFPGVAPMGQVTGNPDGTGTYTAPAVAPPLDEKMPPIDSVEIEIAAMPRPLTALKGMVVADLASANPTVASLTVGGSDGLAAATAPAGATTPVAVTIEPAAGDDATYAWYSTLGELEDYQSAEAQLIAPVEAGTGWLFVVVRDGKGGVAWHGAPLTIQ